MSSLFEKAKKSPDRLKMLIYGDTGTGKTVTSLHFPKPVVVDCEKGTEHYGPHFDFSRIETSDPDVVTKAIDELLKDPNGYKTFILDPITVLYDVIMDRQLLRKRLKTGNSSYEIQPLDYKFIKSDVKRLMSKMLSLDMNVIVTAHAKVLYSPDEFMKIIGTAPECPKYLPHMFDVVLELTKEGDKFKATVDKDRTNKLPPINSTFDFSYESFTKFLGIGGLEREPVEFSQNEHLEQRSGRTFEVELKGKLLKTAGITAENIIKLTKLVDKFGEKIVKDKLRDDYMVDSLLDLRNDEAGLLITDLSTTKQTEKP